MLLDSKCLQPFHFRTLKLRFLQDDGTYHARCVGEAQRELKLWGRMMLERFSEKQKLLKQAFFKFRNIIISELVDYLFVCDR